MTQRHDYPPEKADLLWQICWTEETFTFLEAEGRAYLFGSHAIRAAFGTDGIADVRLHLAPGEAVLSIPSETIGQFKTTVIRNCGHAHDVMYCLNVTRRAMACAIRGYRRNRAQHRALWTQEDAKLQGEQIREFAAELADEAKGGAA